MKGARSPIHVTLACLTALSLAFTFFGVPPEPPVGVPASTSEPAPVHDDGASEDANHLAGRVGVGQPPGGSWSGVAWPPRAPEWAAFLSTVKDIAAGAGHTCALTDAGAVRCWGDNYVGQLGDGTTRFSPTPVDVLGLSGGVVAISASHRHTCALLETGGVKCWGYNRHGEQGDGTTIDHLVPIDVVGLTAGVAAIAAGGFHTCALMAAGGVKCWGANWHGQVGDGSTQQRLTPRDVYGLEQGVDQIATGKYHTCARIAGAGIKCWGYNKFGQIGNGGTLDRHIPVNVYADTAWYTDIALGDLHTCALSPTGLPKCWGDNTEGQLGDGTIVQRVTPRTVEGVPEEVVRLAAGGFHTCAQTASGGAWCWGDNGAGQLGTGATASSLIPVPVQGLDVGVLALEAGARHTCARMEFSGLQCWGSNEFGQIGDGESALRLTPTGLPGLTAGVAQVAPGGLHTCARVPDDAVYCWGNNKYGQLGDGSTMDHLAPEPVNGLGGGVADLAAGGFHACAVTGGGAVKCWGDNGRGQLGDGTFDMRLAPGVVWGLDQGIVAVTAGLRHTCALHGSGAVKCWGHNWAGQLGDGTHDQSPIPVDVVGLSGPAVALAAGESHTCAILAGGGVQCWGDNFYGQLGDGTTDKYWEPVSVVGLGGEVEAISAGSVHTCALLTAGGMRCWGANASGQLGDGTTLGRTQPVWVTGLQSGVASIDAGSFHTCARQQSGVVSCWGDNWVGQLGDGSTTLQTVPVGVQGLPPIAIAVGAGMNHTCAMVSGGAPLCWGTNGYGQIGDGTLPWRTLPTDVLGLAPAQLVVQPPTGSPGSYFVLTGTHFAPDEEITLTVNGQPLTGTVTADTRGGLSVVLATGGAEAGYYTVTATGIFSASATFVLDPNAPYRPKETEGPVLAVPAGIAFTHSQRMPVLIR